MPQNMNESLATENLQRYLRQLSYHDPSITAPPIDGIFEDDTRQSLREFQVSHGLPATGRVDKRTWDALYASYRASLTKHTPPRAVAILPFLREPFELIRGSVGFPVSALQHMLRELSADYAGLDEVEITGIYDDKTVDAVKSFQRNNRLPQSGNTDIPTWNAIVDQYNFLFAAEPYS